MPLFERFVFLLAVSHVNPAPSQIRVRLYDYAGVSSSTLNQAKLLARETLAAAGVDLSWVGCSADPRAPRDAACLVPLTPTDLQIRILDENMARRAPSTPLCLGYAVLGGEFPSIASVFYHRVIELEKGNLAHRSAILGAMLAHEIGHLLLGERTHSPVGVMRGVWDDQDLKILAQGRMRFSRDEAARMADQRRLVRSTEGDPTRSQIPEGDKK